MKQLNDQYFTYRQTPVDYDGVARPSIKGNTLVWNQFVDSGTSSVTLTSGHIYITKVGTTWSRVSGTGESISVTGGSDCVFDLTKMFGSGNEPTLDEFRSLFPLNYYAYNSGSLLNFNGTGIKTTGKNLNPNLGITSTQNAIRVFLNSGNYVFSTNNGLNILANEALYIVLYDAETGGNIITSGGITSSYFALNGSGTKYYSAGGRNNLPFTLNKSCWVAFGFDNSMPSNYTAFQIEFGSSATSYEPYTSSALSLPISTYFPTGMKSANTVYDEISNGKAITRLNEYICTGTDQDSWSLVNHYGSYTRFDNSSVVAKVGTQNFISNQFPSITVGTSNEGISFHGGDGHLILQILTSKLSVDNAIGLMNYFSSNNFQVAYEIATPTEADFKEDIYYYFFDKGTEEVLPSALLNGSVDLGSLTWTEQATSASGFYRMRSTSLRGIIKAVANNSTSANVYTDGYAVITSNESYAGATRGVAVDTSGDLFFNDVNFSTSSSASDFKSAMSGVYLWYEKTDSSPTTSPLFTDIIYYNLTDSEVPYRVFWAINSKGERWDFTEREFKSFMNNPQGLGFSKTISVNRYGNVQNLTDITDNFPQPNGEVLFYDSSNSTRYDKYNQFVKFLSYEPITLYYKIPVSFYSRIPNTYSLECVVGTLTKTESKTDNMMNCSITYNALSFYKGEEVEISGTGTSYTINNDSDFPIGFEIELTGSDMVNPYVSASQNGSVYGGARFVSKRTDATANQPFDRVYLNTKDGEQNIVLEDGGSVLPNPLSYQDLSISNGSIYVTFIKLARGETTLTISIGSGTLSSVAIRYTPIYRSV